MGIVGGFRSVGRGYLKVDKAVHNWLLSRYPQSIGIVDSFLVRIVDKFISSPVFAVILSLVLLVLGVAGIAWIVLVAVLAAWAVCFLWIARSTPIQNLTVISRFGALTLLGFMLAVAGRSFGQWAIKQHHNETSESTAPQSISGAPPLRQSHLTIEQIDGLCFGSFFQKNVRFRVYARLQNQGDTSTFGQGWTVRLVLPDRAASSEDVVIDQPPMTRCTEQPELSQTEFLGHKPTQGMIDFFLSSISFEELRHYLNCETKPKGTIELSVKDSKTGQQTIFRTELFDLYKGVCGDFRTPETPIRPNSSKQGPSDGPASSGIPQHPNNDQKLLSDSLEMQQTLCGYYRQWSSDIDKMEAWVDSSIRYAPAGQEETYRESNAKEKTWRMQQIDQQDSKFYSEHYAKSASELRSDLLTKVPGVGDPSVNYDNPPTSVDLRGTCDDFTKLVDAYQQKVSSLH